MPEELAIALVVLVAAGWILYKVVEGITRAANQTRTQVRQTLGDRRDKKYQKKRALIAAKIRISLPHDLAWAESRLAEATAAFEEQRRVSTWIPERPKWTRTEFTPHAFTPQSRAVKTLDIAEIGHILRPNSRSWREQEDTLVNTQCSYSALLSSPPRRTVKECGLPSLSLNPAVFEILDASVTENAIETYFGKEREDVKAYNARRDELLSKHKALIAAISQWNAAEHERFARYQEESQRMRAEEAKKLRQYADQYESLCLKQRSHFLQTLNGFTQKKSPAVLQRIEYVLSSLQLPASVPRFWNLDYDDEEHILIAEIALPNVVHTPPIKRVQQKAGSVLKPLNQAERRELVPQIHPAMMLRVAFEIFRNDDSETIKLLALNGWVDFIDPQTGLDARAYTASLLVNRDQVMRLNLAQIEPLSAFSALKGKSSGKLVEIIPIEPSLNLKRTDARFVDTKAVLDSLGSTTNLAAMDWQDFEHLIRELFEREFAERGAEVKITQTSRDRGVDAVVFNPDPIQGGKYIIQAKRYTNTVDVSAVRDLCAVVRKEGASRGILVTTSTYGADAYEFANNEPVTLLNGGELLGLLQKHGYNFRIDLAEARRMRATS